MAIAAKASRQESHDPLDLAILAEAGEIKLGGSRVQSFPFTEGKRCEMAIWNNPAAGRTAVAKGAPETIIALCTLAEEEKRELHHEIAQLADTGQKVIACATRQVEAETSGEPVGGFTFAGLIGVSDPVRRGVRESVEEAKDAGIQVIMVTGDHPRTAMAIARTVGLADTPEVISGEELEQALAGSNRQFLAQLDVVARASPAQKLLLVEALQKMGHVVAVTGDGVNDVPALNRADIGIAMGLRGTRSAREVAAIILLDDNFRTITGAIAEGRQLFRNLSTSFAFLLMIHVPLVSTAAIIPLLGYPLLYLPLHIVILELLIHPVAILGFQQSPDRGLEPMQREGRKFFTRRQLSAIALTGIAVTAMILLLFIATVNAGETAQHARAIAFVVLIVSLATMQLILRGLRGLIPKVLAAIAIGTALVLTTISPVASLANLHPLTLPEWLLAALAGGLAALPCILFVFQERKAYSSKLIMTSPE